MTVTRRALLVGAVGAAGLTAAACRDRKDATAPPPAADATALRAALDDERRILAAYDELLAGGATAVEVSAARAQHAEHAKALAALLAATTSGTPTAAASTGAASSGAALRQEVQASPARLRAAALTAHDPQAAVVLASVAAAHLALPPVGGSRDAWYGGTA